MNPEERFARIEDLLEVVGGRLIEVVDMQKEQAKTLASLSQIQKQQATALKRIGRPRR